MGGALRRFHLIVHVVSHFRLNMPSLVTWEVILQSDTVKYETLQLILCPLSAMVSLQNLTFNQLMVRSLEVPLPTPVMVLVWTLWQMCCGGGGGGEGLSEHFFMLGFLIRTLHKPSTPTCYLISPSRKCKEACI